MAVDFKVLFQTFYPAGPNNIYVNAATGNDANPGTLASPKATILGGVNAIGSGGVVHVADGDYYDLNLGGKNFSAGSYCLIIADNLWGARINSTGNWNVVNFSSSSYIGIYGFEIIGQDISSNIYNSGVGSNGPINHIAIWKCHVHHCGSGGIGFAGNFGPSSYASVCYNVIHNTSRWFYFAASAISFYEFSDIGPADAYGFHDYVVGNVCYYNYNEPSPATAQTDGNGIIIDDAQHTQSGGSPYNGRTLVFQNLCVNNGGRGVHAPWSGNTMYAAFNTVGQNCWSLNDPGNTAGELSQNQGSSGELYWNVSWCRSDHNDWLDGYLAFGPTDRNVFCEGVYAGTASIDRTADGGNYFATNSPSLLPSTVALQEQWRPDGGSGIVEKVTIPAGVYSSFSRWPDLFGDYRPTDRVWTIGFTEATGGGGTSGQAYRMIGLI